MNPKEAMNSESSICAIRLQNLFSVIFYHSQFSHGKTAGFCLKLAGSVALPAFAESSCYKHGPSSSCSMSHVGC